MSKIGDLESLDSCLLGLLQLIIGCTYARDVGQCPPFSDTLSCASGRISQMQVDLLSIVILAERPVTSSQQIVNRVELFEVYRTSPMRGGDCRSADTGA